MTSRSIEAVADAFCFPHPVHFEGEMQVILSRDQFVTETRAYLAKLKENGVVAVEVPEIIFRMPGPGRCRVLVLWNYLNVDGGVQSSTRNELFLSTDAAGDVRISQINIELTSNETLRSYYKKGEIILN